MDTLFSWNNGNIHGYINMEGGNFCGVSAIDKDLQTTYEGIK